MATANQVSQLFVALYNRAIDGVTAQQYGGRAYNQGFISEVIGLTPALRTMTNQEFVELVYKNALGKDNNSDKAGIDYWVSQANENNWRREQLTDNLLRSINAWADQNADTTGLTQEQITLASQGATVFRTKVAIAEQAATTVGGQADTYALTFGSGLEDVTILNYNTTRENNSKILQGIAARNPLAQSGGATIALGLNPDTGEGQENFLAPGDPNIPQAASGSTYVYQTSTDFDDVVTGTVAATDPTFTSDAQIDAGKGNDTLKLNMSTSFTGLSGDGRVTGVERIELTNTTVNDNVTFNASGIRDVYTYVLNGANGINLTNVAYNEYLLIEMNNIKSTGNTTTSSGSQTVTNGGVTQITFDTTPTGGRLDLNFNSVGYDSTDNKISNHDILFGIGSGTAIASGQSADDFANQAAGIGILNIALTGNNYADIVNNGVNRITVGGNGSLTTNLSQGVTYFNGTNATGALNITALAPKDVGENGTNIFEYFTTGSASDKVHIAVERLGQNANVNLGLGNDTLTLSGQVDHEARKQFYNFNTIENLVFGELTGDALLIDLGTTVVTTPQDPIISGSGSKKTEIPQPDIVTTTQDRSANLQTITFEDGASVQLTSLGKKDLKVTYNGTQDDQKVLVDTEGTVNLVLQGSDAGASGTGVKGGGFVNLSNAKAVNVDLTGQGFEGFLSAGNAVDLNINNYTGDKKLKLKANTQTEKNDLSSVVNLTIDTEAQDINASGASSTAHSVDIENADLASIKAITLKGTGGVKLGELANKEGITIAGANYSGRLDTGNIYAGPGPLSITTKGAITTGNLTGNNITIDLSKNITTTEGQYNNNIGTIYVERVDATNSSGTLTYTTGISGTQGVETTNADGTINPNDTQNIVVNTSSATLNINGAGGVDKFNIEASSFTKTLTISGNLGTVPNYEEAKNNYDSVRIDLSKTSGVDLNISNLLVSNPNDEGIIITASKGADNITLVAGANHDIIEFSAGSGSSAGAREVYSVDLGNLRLANSQSFTIDGLTITNIGDTGIVRATEIAKAIADYANNGTVAAGFNITGKLGSLTGDWAGATASASGGTLNITAQPNRNLKDLDLKFGGNGSTNAPTDITAQIIAGAASASASISAANPVPVNASLAGDTAFTYTAPTLTANTAGSTFGFSVTIDGTTTNYKLMIGNQAGTTAPTIDDIVNVLNNAGEIIYETTNNRTIKIVATADAATALNVSPLINLNVKAEADGGSVKIVAGDNFNSSSVAGSISDGTNTYTITAATTADVFTFVDIGTPAQAFRPAADAITAAFISSGSSASVATDNGAAKAIITTGLNSGAATTFDVTIGSDTYKLTFTATANATSAKVTDNELTAILNGTDDIIAGDIDLSVTGAGTSFADYTAALAGAGLKFSVDATTNNKITATVSDTSVTFSGDVKLNDGTNSATWTIAGVSPAVDQIGTAGGVEPVGGNLAWTGKLITTAQTQAEIFKLTVDGNTFTVKGDVAANVTVSATDILNILKASATTTFTNTKIFNSAGGEVTGGTNLKTILENVGAKVDTALGGIAGNEIKIVADDTKSANLTDPATTITITPSNAFNANNTAVSWNAQASQDEPAQPDTSTIVINGHNIVFSDVVLTASALENAVFELITAGTLDSLSSADRAKVTIDGQTFNRANAKDNKALFVIEGTEYRQVDGGGIELVLTDPASYTGNASIEFSQTNGNGDGSDQTFNIVGAHGDSFGQVVVSFNALAAGQSYTFDGKTIIATKNLSANEVANAFTLTTDDTVDGAVVVSDFENIGEDVLYYVPSGSSTLTIQGTSLTSIPAGISTTITGTGSLGVNTNGVSASTTQQGSDGSGTRADSYVVFAETTNAEGAIVGISANTSAMDSITNFDVANDGLRLRDGNGGYYGEGQVATSISAHTIYVAADSTLAASVANGIISFSVNNGDNGSATAENITLDAKLHVATHDIGTNKVAGFEHNGDFYVVATGGISGASTDDIVVKLNGVAGISDITNLLA